KGTDERAKAGIGYVPQGRDIFSQLTVEENLLLGLEASREKKPTIPQEVYEMFPVLKDMLHRKGGDLSGGQQQQLAIARALVSRPKLLILDEPTEGIQPSIIQDIGQAIRTIRAQGEVSILVVEQYLEFMLDLADYFYVMEKGSIVTQGLVAEMDKGIISEYLTV
ncbi:MAG TPA: ATP-binding cassette domain-containing protein, partial [Bacillota bacterium]|nr:ATP-binding cassette domain-containing protein [Bacillota bacterium]